MIDQTRQEYEQRIVVINMALDRIEASTIKNDAVLDTIHAAAYENLLAEFDFIGRKLNGEIALTLEQARQLIALGNASTQTLHQDISNLIFSAVPEEYSQSFFDVFDRLWSSAQDRIELEFRRSLDPKE